MSQSSQKFIARNRAPRVQIEYDVETYGSEKKVRLPFVMAVLADLAGQSSRRIEDVAQRRFADIDVDNFDQRMKALAPRLAFTVPNTLAGQGRLAVDMSFESMDDFSPAAIAAKVEPLRRLLQARVQLANLQTYMDGKSGAEELVRRLLGDPRMLRAVAEPAELAEPAGPAETIATLTPAACASPSAPTSTSTSTSTAADADLDPSGA